MTNQDLTITEDLLEIADKIYQVNAVNISLHGIALNNPVNLLELNEMLAYIIGEIRRVADRVEDETGGNGYKW